MQSLAERYRPRTWDAVLGQGKAVKALLRIRDAGGFGGRAYWISGSSGTGKTTIARLIASDLAEPWSIEEIDAQDCTMEFVRDMERGFSYRAMGSKSGKAWIINEAHGLRGMVLSRFLTALESLPEHACVIFTTTKEGQADLFGDMPDASPLLSRCLTFALTTRGLKEVFAKRLHEVADIEGINGKEPKWYERLMMDARNNMRAGYSALEAGAALAD